MTVPMGFGVSGGRESKEKTSEPSSPISPMSPTSVPPQTPTPTTGGHESLIPIKAAPLGSPGVSIEFVLHPGGALNLDGEHDNDTPLRFRTLDNVLGPSSLPGWARHSLDVELLLAFGDEPTTFEEARSEEIWRKAMAEEMYSIEQNGTWNLVDLPPDHRPIGLKWIDKIKRNEKGSIVKYKARLVAKGYIQQVGIDYAEVFAPIARMESVRMVLAMAARGGWYVHHMDVKLAFLNGDLQEEVYVQQPPGFVAAGHEGKVLRLKKALYKLKQVSHAWNQKLDSSQRDLGFIRCASEHGLYTRGVAMSRVIVGVYIDDLIITGSCTKEVKAFKDEMKCLFRMSDLGLLSYYLGIEVKQNRGASL
ncbi:hypothetical protein GUJ93_ZPchr0008g13842 [Zizania palustris]|uniref:Reverse transcriptase Ty1/copia-type domain-containing protein n=1 Tax=Zizania palustris TaxID=103762 RepID=A0A8J5RPD3_ZIZPA|nr:hypothetical protein GUJ93_ZPchr0008g13842 [Zizania palustris]